jgi:hypothetical protein
MPHPPRPAGASVTRRARGVRRGHDHHQLPVRNQRSRDRRGHLPHQHTDSALGLPRRIHLQSVPPRRRRPIALSHRAAGHVPPGAGGGDPRPRRGEPPALRRLLAHRVRRVRLDEQLARCRPARRGRGEPGGGDDLRRPLRSPAPGAGRWRGAEPGTEAGPVARCSAPPPQLGMWLPVRELHPHPALRGPVHPRWRGPSAPDRVRRARPLGGDATGGPGGRRHRKLSFNEERSAEEIAARLETTPGNVRLLRHRAVAQLRRCLDPSPVERS